MTNKRVVVALPGDQTISFTREFDASVELVFDAHIDPALVAQWTGPRGTAVTLRQWDPRTGGSWSYVVAGKGGSWGFHGSFHEVTEPRRIVQSWEYEGEPGHPSFETFTFVPLDDGRCRIEGVSLFFSLAERDAVLADFDTGRDEDFERLDELLSGRG